MIPDPFPPNTWALWFINQWKEAKKALLYAYPIKPFSINGQISLSLFVCTQDFVLGTICKPLKLEKSFVYENGSEFFLQYDTVKNYYEQGYRKAPIVYQITSILI